MADTAVFFWTVDLLLASFIIWRLYHLYKESRTCPWRQPTPEEEQALHDLLDQIPLNPEDYPLDPNYPGPRPSDSDKPNRPPPTRPPSDDNPPATPLKPCNMKNPNTTNLITDEIWESLCTSALNAKSDPLTNVPDSDLVIIKKFVK